MKVMVTITVQRDGSWEPDRTLTLSTGPGVEGDAGITAWWLSEFPKHLSRALGRDAVTEADDEPDEPEAQESLW